MVIAFHSIFTAYGFWLPNEPRGSWSDFVAAWELRRFGPATTVTTRRSIAKTQYDHALKSRMQATLKHSPVKFTGEQARTIGCTFAASPYVIHACALLQEHVHLVIAHTPRHIRSVIGDLKSAATRALREQGPRLHPMVRSRLERLPEHARRRRARRQVRRKQPHPRGQAPSALELRHTIRPANRPRGDLTRRAATPPHHQLAAQSNAPRHNAHLAPSARGGRAG